MLFVPYGSFISELLDSVIPNLRLERIVDFLKKLDLKVTAIDESLENFKLNLSSEEGIDLFEEGLLQASRAVNEERKQRLASILAHSLSSEELEYEESKKIFNIFKELTDQETIWLIYYSLPQTTGTNGPRFKFREKHSDVLTPLSTLLNRSEKDQKKIALQDSYKDTLVRFGLIKDNGRNSYSLTILGGMLVDYISD